MENTTYGGKKMAYEEILTVNSSIQSKRTTKTIANSSTETLKDGELLIVRDENNPPNLRAGDGTTQIKNLKDIVPGAASTSTAGLMSASDKTKLDGIATGANKTIVDGELSASSTNPVQNKVINAELGKKLSLSGGTMTGALTMKGIKLTSGTDYGATLPSSPVTNQLFFQTAETNFVLDNVYPIGSIYMNVNSTNPGTLFGGTWEQIQGKFLLGMSSSYPAGSQGGEASHTLTTEEMPSHGHNPANQSGYFGFITNSKKAFEVGDMGVQSGSGRYYPYSTTAFDISRNSLTGTTGGGKSHNNMPPYLSIYIWKRTA
jgi:hypothetical protein